MAFFHSQTRGHVINLILTYNFCRFITFSHIKIEAVYHNFAVTSSQIDWYAIMSAYSGAGHMIYPFYIIFTNSLKLLIINT